MEYYSASLFLSASWGPLFPLDFSLSLHTSPRELTFLSTFLSNVGASAAVMEKFLLTLVTLAG